VSRARRLASGHTPGGKAVLYTPAPLVAAAQVVKRNLKRIGLDVEVKGWPPGVHLAKLGNPGEPWDIAFFGWAVFYPDPNEYLNTLFDPGSVDSANLPFNSAKYNRLLQKAARKQGAARYQTYGQLDVDLARRAAPMIAVEYLNAATFVSKHVDPRCIILPPDLDLTAVCLTR
jgi:ABC-type oligopeptide transport system substrate-binding subunit